MAPRRLAPIGAAIVVLLFAASAPAATKVKALADALPTGVSGFGTGSSFVWLDWCQVMRVTPGAGADTGTANVYAGTPCGTEFARDVYTGPTNVTSAGFGPDGPIAQAADNSLYVTDSPLGLVDRITPAGTPTVVTIAGTHAGCGVPADGSLAKDANLCDQSIWGLAADPVNAGKFVIWDVGDQTDAGRRIYLVSGTGRADSTIKTVAGSCNGAAPTAALQLCLPLFGVSIAYLDSDTLLVGLGSSVLKVTLSTGAVATVATADAVTAVTRGFAGNDYFYGTTVCTIRHVAGDGTDTLVAGTGTCDPTQRQNDVEATQSPFGEIYGLASYPGGVLVLDKSNYGGFPTQIRLVDRTSLLAGAPPPFTNDINVSIAFAGLPGDGNGCYIGGAFFGEQFGVDCPSPYERTAYTDNWLFEVWGSNGTTDDPTPATVRWTTDTVAPDAPELLTPAADGAVDSATPTLTWKLALDNGIFPVASGISAYDVVIDGKQDSSGGCCEAQPLAPLAEGTHMWAIRARDKAGNSATSETRSFTYGSPPHAGLTVSPNPALAGATITLNASTSSDREGPIASYAFDLDGDGNFEKDTGTSPTATTSFPTAGTFKVGVKVTDGVGRTDQTDAEVKVNAQAIPAGLLGVTINNGAQYTRDPNVELGVKFPASITAILVSNDGGFLLPQSFPPQPTIKWRLDSSGPERLPKIVYVRFQNGLAVSDNFTDDIILDETPPVVQQASLAGASSTGAIAAKARRYTVKVKATDSNSGVKGLQVTANKRKPGKLLAYRKKLSLGSAAKPKFVRASDRAGNFSRWKKLR